jgi:hypothetical protein
MLVRRQLGPVHEFRYSRTLCQIVYEPHQEISTESILLIFIQFFRTGDSIAFRTGFPIVK